LRLLDFEQISHAIEDGLSRYRLPVALVVAAELALISATVPAGVHLAAAATSDLAAAAMCDSDAAGPG
jgi:hypothetical protein